MDPSHARVLSRAQASCGSVANRRGGFGNRELRRENSDAPSSHVEATRTPRPGISSNARKQLVEVAIRTKGGRVYALWVNRVHRALGIFSVQQYGGLLR